MNKLLQIIITTEIIATYTAYYFNKYKTRKKQPLKSPIPPSMNEFTSWIRQKQNSEKQKWKEFIIWYVKYYELHKAHEIPVGGITKCTVHMHIIFPTKMRHDLDNYTLGMKFIGDGLVESGLLIDDSYSVVSKLTLTALYEKNVKQVVLQINY